MNEWIFPKRVGRHDLCNFNERDKIMFKNIKLKNSPVEKLFDHIRNFEIKEFVGIKQERMIVKLSLL